MNIFGGVLNTLSAFSYCCCCCCCCCYSYIGCSKFLSAIFFMLYIRETIFSASYAVTFCKL